MVHLHISLGVPTARQSIQNVWEEGVGSSSMVGRKRLEFHLEVIWEFSLHFAYLERSSFLMAQLKCTHKLLLAL